MTRVRSVTRKTTSALMTLGTHDFVNANILCTLGAGFCTNPGQFILATAEKSRLARCSAR